MRADDDLALTTPARAADDAGAQTPRVRLVDFDAASRELLLEWLRDDGLTADAAGADDERVADALVDPCDLVLLHLPYPRRDRLHRMQAVRLLWPRAAVVVLSPTFRAGVAAGGQLAHELGAQAIVAMPATRHALIAAVRLALAQRR